MTNDTYDFEKLFGGYIQIYLNNIPQKTKQQKKYLYIYRILMDNMDNSCVKIYEGDVFPDYLTLSSTGYMFVKKAKSKPKIPMLPEIDIHQYKTNFFDFNTFFTTEVDANVMLKLTPANYVKKNTIETNPRIVDEYNYLMKLDANSKLDMKKLMTNWTNDVDVKKVTTPLKWFEYIKSNCPINSQTNIVYNYCSKINSKSFKDDLDFNGVCVYYDIKSTDEFEIMKNIELEFENKKQLVTFQETYNNKLEEVIKRCDSKKIPYKKINDYSIELKWCDLNNLGLEWEITDFI